MIGQHTSTGDKVFVSYSAIHGAFAVDSSLIGRVGRFVKFADAKAGIEWKDLSGVLVDFGKEGSGSFFDDNSDDIKLIPQGVLEKYNPVLYAIEFAVYKLFTQEFWLEKYETAKNYFKNLPWMKGIVFAAICFMALQFFTAVTRSNLEKLALERADLIEQRAYEVSLQQASKKIQADSEARVKKMDIRMQQIQFEENLKK